MTWLETPCEWRHSVRVNARGSILVRCGARPIYGRIHDLGSGGINMHADLPFGIAGLTGRGVHLDLQLDAFSARRFALDGHVLRASIATKIIAIAFDAVPCDYEDFIQDLLLAAVEHQRSGSTGEHLFTM